jgi:hypothetical protein
MANSRANAYQSIGLNIGSSFDIVESIIKYDTTALDRGTAVFKGIFVRAVAHLLTKLAAGPKPPSSAGPKTHSL